MQKKVNRIIWIAILIICAFYTVITVGYELIPKENLSAQTKDILYCARAFLWLALAVTVIFLERKALRKAGTESVKKQYELLTNKCDIEGYLDEISYYTKRGARITKVTPRNKVLHTFMINKATALAARGDYDEAVYITNDLLAQKYDKKCEPVKKLGEVYRASYMVMRGGEKDLAEAREVIAETESWLEGREESIYGEAIGENLTRLKYSADAAEHKNVGECIEYYEKQLESESTVRNELNARSRLAGLYRDAGEAEKEREQLEKIVAAKRDQLICTRRAAERLAELDA